MVISYYIVQQSHTYSLKDSPLKTAGLSRMLNKRLTYITVGFYLYYPAASEKNLDL